MIGFRFDNAYYIFSTQQYTYNDAIKIIICCLLGSQKNTFSILPLDIRQILLDEIFDWNRYKLEYSCNSKEDKEEYYSQVTMGPRKIAWRNGKCFRHIKKKVKINKKISQIKR